MLLSDMIVPMKRVYSGIEYEEWCATYLRNHGFHKILLTKVTGDQGIDIIAYKGNRKYGIQCKFYDTPVGNSSVQEAYAGAAFYGCDIALVMTNTTFTKGAQQLAEQTEVLLWPLKDPTKESGLLRFYYILRILEGIVGAVLFFYVVINHELPCRDDISLCAILFIFGSCLGFFSHQSFSINIMAMIDDIAILVIQPRLINYQVLSSSIPWWLGNSILLLLSFWYFLQQYQQRKKHLYEMNQLRLQEQQQMELQQQAMQLCTLLENSLHCHLDIIESRKDNDIEVHCFHADKTISTLLPSVQITLNQQSSIYMYQILDLGRRKIQVSLTPIKQNG